MSARNIDSQVWRLLCVDARYPNLALSLYSRERMAKMHRQEALAEHRFQALARFIRERKGPVERRWLPFSNAVRHGT